MLPAVIKVEFFGGFFIISMISSSACAKWSLAEHLGIGNTVGKKVTVSVTRLFRVFGIYTV